MKSTPFDSNTLIKIQELIEANFAGREELYAAANSLDNAARENICRRLADHLAANAIELQQLLAASGIAPAEPLDTAAIAHALFDLAKLNRGESGVLDTAAEGEDNLKKVYDSAIEATEDEETTALFRRQRREVTFGEDVLRNIEPSGE